jgi:endonuclease/exonuclease/phosphatase family metal-dependent hydrolase
MNNKKGNSKMHICPSGVVSNFCFKMHTSGTFSKIDHILGHKASLSKYEKIEIIPCILSDHNAIKLELNNKNKDKTTCKQLVIA